MVTVDISIEDISKLMGYDEPLDVEKLDEMVSYAISEVDSEPEGPDENGHTKVSIDVKTSNRPDLWGAEGIARIVQGINGKLGLPPLEVAPSGYEINVDPGLKDVRPYIGAAVVRNLVLDDFLIKQMIQIQDKVDFSFGRKRKRTSIGIYNINMLESPIEYKLVDRTFKFQPLAYPDELSVDEIFETHPKGIEYRHILDEFERVPMLMDINNRVLSMPPIINSNDVGRVTEETTDVLVEITGTNYGATIQALAVVVQALRDRGGEVSSVKINYPEEIDVDNDVTPHSDPLEIEVDPKQINNYLGTNISTKQMMKLIRMRRNEAEKKGTKILVKLPPWRRDVLHWVDISEDIAIAYGYNKFDITQAEVVTAGKVDSSTEDENLIREIMIGMRLVEVLNYTLTNLDTLAMKVQRDEDWVNQHCIEISNPASTNFNYVRPELLPGLIRLLSNNTHNEYPQRIFETGEVVVKVKNTVLTNSSCSVALAGYEETFETIVGVLDTLTRLVRFEYRLEELNSSYYISGRAAKVIINDLEVGHLGEIHPQILNNYGIEVPISAMEIRLNDISGLSVKSLDTNKN